MPYVPTQAPGEMKDFDELRKWVESEFRNLASSFASGDLSTSSAIAGVIPSGSRMVFQQTAAPTGWTKDVTHNDKLLRIVSGTASSGGSNAFSTVNAQTVVGNHTLAASEAPNLSVSVNGTITVYPAGDGQWYFPIANGPWGLVNAPATGPYPCSYTNNSMTYTNYCQGVNTMNGATTSGGGGAHNHPITMGIQYVDLIIATKN